MTGDILPLSLDTKPGLGPWPSEATLLTSRLWQEVDKPAMTGFACLPDITGHEPMVGFNALMRGLAGPPIAGRLLEIRVVVPW